MTFFGERFTCSLPWLLQLQNKWVNWQSVIVVYKQRPKIAFPCSVFAIPLRLHINSLSPRPQPPSLFWMPHFFQWVLCLRRLFHTGSTAVCIPHFIGDPRKFLTRPVSLLLAILRPTSFPVQLLVTTKKAFLLADAYYSMYSIHIRTQMHMGGVGDLNSS